MTMSLKERFHEVDRVPTPWDSAAAHAEAAPIRRPRAHLAAAGLVAAALAAVATVVAVQLDGDGPAPAADASWLVETGQMCVERSSAETLPNRDWAFEGVIAAIDPPSDPAAADAGAVPTTVTFDVERWFWGGSADQVSVETYATPSSAGAVDSSIGAHLLASGDDQFLWSCGFTKPFSDGAQQEFEAAATRAGT